MNDISFDVPEYYRPEFKGRKPKYCTCGRKMKYDGWSVDVRSQKISEWWFCKKCDKMIENPQELEE